MQLSNGQGGVLSMHMLLPVGDACAMVICKAMALTSEDCFTALRM